MATTNRIALFAGRRLFGMGRTIVFPSGRRMSAWSPAKEEVLRLMRTETCFYCSRPMDVVFHVDGIGRLLLCRNCGYWGGRGTKELGHGALNEMGVLGAVLPHAIDLRQRLDAGVSPPHSVDLNADALTFDHLLSQLRALPARLLELSPHRAEAVVMRLLSDRRGREHQIHRAGQVAPQHSQGGAGRRRSRDRGNIAGTGGSEWSAGHHERALVTGCTARGRGREQQGGDKHGPDQRRCGHLFRSARHARARLVTTERRLHEGEPVAARRGGARLDLGPPWDMTRQRSLSVFYGFGQ